MASHVDLTEFRGYLANTFPCARLDSHPIDFGSVHLRFELGGDHPNGSDKRILQAIERSVELFQAINVDGDEIILVVNDWSINCNELWSSEPPDYLFTLVQGFDAQLACSETVDGDEQESSHQQTFYPTNSEHLEYASILKGIANLEQGREPAIGESVYFVNRSKNIVFYMYDDRGCLIYSDTPEKLLHLYSQRNDWLVDYHRAHFDEVFGGKSS